MNCFEGLVSTFNFWMNSNSMNVNFISLEHQTLILRLQVWNFIWLWLACSQLYCSAVTLSFLLTPEHIDFDLEIHPSFRAQRCHSHLCISSVLVLSVWVECACVLTRITAPPSPALLMLLLCGGGWSWVCFLQHKHHLITLLMSNSTITLVAFLVGM